MTALAAGAAAAAGVVVAALALRHYWAHVRRRFLRVTDGVFRSGTMPPSKLLRRVRRHGIRTVIDFRRPSPEVDAEREALRAAGVEHVNLPSTQTPSREELDCFLDTMRGAQRPVLLHCNHGSRRAPTYAAAYLVHVEGWDDARAVRRAYWPSLKGRRKYASFLARQSGPPADAARPRSSERRTA